MDGPRVLVLVSTLAVGGAERQLAALVPGLAGHGFAVRVATLRGPGRFFDELGERGVETVHIGMRSRYDALGALRVYRLWRDEPRLVLTQGLDAHVLGQLVARRARAARVAIEQGGPGLARSGLQRRLASYAAARADRVVAVAAAQNRELEALGYDAGAIRTVPNGSTTPVPSRSRADVRRELGIDDADVVVLLPAALRPEKRADVFVDALLEAQSRDARVKGVVAGGGPLLAEIRARADGAGRPVLVLGERPDIADLMQAADVVCLSSDVEGVPLAALEAMALGRALVATRVGGLPEVVEHERTGLLVPANDPGALAAAVLGLAADEPRRVELGASGRTRYLASYTAERMVARYAEILAELHAQRASHAR